MTLIEANVGSVGTASLPGWLVPAGAGPPLVTATVRTFTVAGLGTKSKAAAGRDDAKIAQAPGRGTKATHVTGEGGG